MRTTCKLLSGLVLMLIMVGSALGGTVDVDLENLLDRGISSPDQAPAHVSVSRDANGVLMVSVIIDGVPGPAAQAVANAGGNVRSVVAGRYMTATLPVAAVRGLSRNPNIRHIEAATRVKLLNDEGNKPEGNNSRSTDTFAPPYVSDLSPVDQAGAGAGVVVAVVDTGIDIFHPDFRNEDGSTRVLSYWDQSDYSKGGGVQRPSDLGFDYGREYGQAELDAILSGAGGASLGSTARDTHGHGSHVAGTAAGNGRGDADGSDTVYQQYQLTGVAPKASLIIVQYDFDGDRNDTSFLVDAVSYCFQRAAALNMPCALNLSLGIDIGPHDGTTFEEQSLDALTGPGKVILCAAGNAGEMGANWSPANHLPPADKIHGSLNIPAGGTGVIQFDPDYNALGASSNDYIFFDAWYAGSGSCDVTLESPDGDIYTNSAWPTGAGGSGIGTNDGAIFVYNGGDQFDWGTTNGDNEMYIEISDYYSNPVSSYNLNADGTWTVSIHNTGTSTLVIESWHGLSDNLRGTLLTYDGSRTDNRMTVGSPATGANTIAIGAYTTRTLWPGTTDPIYNATTFPAVMYDLAFFSSRGPDRLGRTQPDVTGPGVGIISCLSRDVPLSEAWVAGSANLYQMMQGTSMSTPNATGCAALALAVDPTLTPAELRTHFQNGARVDAFVTNSAFASDATGSAPNNDWGAGKIDVVGLITEVLAHYTPPANSAPVASNGSASTTVDTAVDISLVATDADNDPLTYSIVTGPSNGSVSLAGNVATYTPNSSFTGNDSFTFKANDGEDDSNIATVSITVDAAPTPGVAPDVTGISPDNGNAGDVVDVTITGANFVDGASVNAGDKVSAQQVTVVDANTITCRFRINKRAASGTRDITVTNPDGSSGVLAAGFRVN